MTKHRFNVELASKEPQSLAARKRKRNPNRALTEAEIRHLLSSLDNIRDDALIRLGLSVGMRVSEVVSIRTSEIDFESGLIRIWDEKKDKWRLVMPTLETMGALKRYLSSLPKQPQYVFGLSTKTIERITQKHSQRALGYVISWHSLCTTYVSRSVELEQSPAVVMVNTGESLGTILRYYTKHPRDVMRRYVEGRSVIPSQYT